MIVERLGTRECGKDQYRFGLAIVPYGNDIRLRDERKSNVWALAWIRKSLAGQERYCIYKTALCSLNGEPIVFITFL